MTRLCCIAVLLVALGAASDASAQQAAATDHPIRLAQAADQTTTIPTPTVTPNSSSATCLSGCSTNR